MYYVSEIDVYRAKLGVLQKFIVPAIRYDMNLCATVDSLRLEIREFGTGYVSEIKCSGDWQKFGEALGSISPYGYFHTPEDMKRRSFGMIVAYDELSYKFLSYVDKFDMACYTHIDDSPFWRVCADTVFKPLDEYGAVLSFFDRTQFHGGFTLLHVVTSLPQNWHEDGEFYIHLFESINAIYRLKFSDKTKARQLIAKASTLFKENKLLAGREALRSISRW